MNESSDGTSLPKNSNGLSQNSSGGCECDIQRDIEQAEKSLSRVADDFKHYLEHLNATPPTEEETVVLERLLAVLDILEPLLESSDYKPLEVRQRVGGAVHVLMKLLLEKGIVRETDLGHPYNPGRHVLHCLKNDPTKLENTVLEVVQSGYRRGDVVFRPAKVVVNVLDQTAVGDGS
jgi:molecular chaperone GrpE (heat shock protein)